MKARKAVAIGMRPSHPGAILRVEVLDELGLSVSLAARVQAWHDTYVMRQRANEIRVKPYKAA